MENKEIINPDKFLKRDKYSSTPGGCTACMEACSKEQVYACFNRHVELYNKDLLPKNFNK